LGILEEKLFVLNYYDVVESWLWIRFTLPANIMTKERIDISCVMNSSKYYHDGQVYFHRYVSNYPIDTSFSTQNELEAPTEFLIEGVTFMFSENVEAKDRQMLKDNYSYRLWLQQKWFHQGPMRMFPTIINATDVDIIKVPYCELPWIDKWETPLVVLPQMKLGVELNGIPFTPTKDMDIIIGIAGKMKRSVQ
jgi:hypothetical protein